VHWLARLRREAPNLRAALEFCLTEPGEAETGLRMATALHWYWLTRGLFSEGRQWLERALAQQAPPATTARVNALYNAAMLAGFQCDIPSASALVKQARDLAEQLGDARARTLATHAAAVLAMFSSDLPRAVAGFQEVLDVYRVEGNLLRQLEALSWLALASGLLGDTARAVACHEEMLAVTEPRGEVWFRSYSLYYLGIAVWLRGDSRRAAGLLEQSLRLKRLVDELLGTVWCLEALAWITAEEHDPRRAANLLGAAESLSQAMGTPPAIFPDLLAYHEQCERQARQALGEQAFQTAFHHGKSLSVEDAVAYALNEQPRTTPSPASTAATLTRREQQVADLIVHGLTNKEIATQLVIAQRTAEAHVKRILAKLSLTTRTQLAVWTTHQLTTRTPDHAPGGSVSRALTRWAAGGAMNAEG
jgi:non-specific serine/threonine protein kinase